MKILVLSDTAWNNGNSFGNSFTNIFDGVEDLDFASVYCREGFPNYERISQALMITEKQMLRNLKDKRIPTAVRVSVGDKQAGGSEWNMVNVGRKHRWQIMFWARELIWKIGRWKSQELKAFLDEFRPDLIFQPVYYSGYINDIALFIKQYTGAPMVGYTSDDIYTLRQFNLSPLYWIDRFWKRGKVRRTVKQCEILYVISDIQKQEYEKAFSVPCKVLTKGADFQTEPPAWPAEGSAVKLVYAGNLGGGRWESLGLLAQAVEQLRKENYKPELEIYTPTPISRAMEKKLGREGCTIHKPVPYEEILRLQKQADILIHTEGTSLRSRLAVRLSFSTKLVDFFKMGKCIFAIGPRQVASMEHLIENDAAVTAAEKTEVYEGLKKLLQDPGLLAEYGQRAYECGRKYHDIEKIQAMLKEDLNEAVRKR